MTAPFERNGITLGTRIVCEGFTGTVTRCAPDGVSVRWDDDTFGELVWDDTAANNAYRLQVQRTFAGALREPDAPNEHLRTAARNADKRLGPPPPTQAEQIEQIRKVLSDVNVQERPVARAKWVLTTYLPRFRDRDQALDTLYTTIQNPTWQQFAAIMSAAIYILSEDADD